MAKWNPQSAEVQQELQNIRDYGNLDVLNFRHPCGDSYKSQACRELAANMYLREQIRDLHNEINEHVDRIESLEPEVERLKEQTEAGTCFLQKEGFLSQHEVEKMKSVLDSYYERWQSHKDACLKAAEYESPQYWKAQEVVAAIWNVINEMSPQNRK